MATEVKPGKWSEVRQIAASKGLSLTQTAARAVFPFGTEFLQLIGTTYSTAVVAQVHLNPWLVILKTADGNATFTDYSVEAQDGSTATSVVLSSLDTLANGDALYVGSHIPFGGVHIDVDATNGTASVLTVHYRKDDGTWADISATDNTASGGATLAQDGTVTWTVPADWTTARLQDLDADSRNSGLYGELFWTRWTVSAALDASTTLDHMLSLNRSATPLELPASLPWEQTLTVGPGGLSHLSATCDAGTALLLVNCAAQKRFA